jgi:hypothetical protein
MPMAGGPGTPVAERTQLLPGGAGARAAEKTQLLPGGAGAPGTAPRTELLTVAPGAGAAAGRPGAGAPGPIVVGGGARGGNESMPAIETIIEHRFVPPQTPAAKGATPGRSGARILVVAAVLGLFVIVAVAAAGVWWWLSHRNATAAAAPAASPVPTVIASVPLHVVAVPWGMATVRDASGAPLPGAAGTAQPTPLLLMLSPGHYVVAVSNPELGPGEQRCEVDVQPARPGECRVVLAQPSADDYFKAVGWR